MRWPWKRHPLPPPVDAEHPKRLREAAASRETQTERVTTEMRVVIAENHIAYSVKKAVES